MGGLGFIFGNTVQLTLSSLVNMVSVDTTHVKPDNTEWSKLLAPAGDLEPNAKTYRLMNEEHADDQRLRSATICSGLQVGWRIKEVRKMLLLKACPRCRGDLHFNGDIYGEYKECLQCGLMLDIEKKNDVLAATVERSRKRAKVA
jgi:hypothetical protein